MQKIVLYGFESCPYCQKVQGVLKELKLPYGAKEVSRDRSSKERLFLLEKSGVATVPVIEIDWKFIGESEKIISYLKKSYGK